MRHFPVQSNPRNHPKEENSLLVLLLVQGMPPLTLRANHHEHRCRCRRFQPWSAAWEKKTKYDAVILRSKFNEMFKLQTIYGDMHMYIHSVRNSKTIPRKALVAFRYRLHRYAILGSIKNFFVVCAIVSENGHNNAWKGPSETRMFRSERQYCLHWQWLAGVSIH